MVRCPAWPHAVAQIKGGADAPQLCGEVRFYQECGNVLVVADISGIPTCGGEGFAQTGGHYNPQKRPTPITRGIFRR